MFDDAADQDIGGNIYGIGRGGNVNDHIAQSMFERCKVSGYARRNVHLPVGTCLEAAQFGDDSSDRTLMCRTGSGEQYTSCGKQDQTTK
jgi:hypothetical protein